MALYEHRQSTFIELSLVQVVYSPSMDSYVLMTDRRSSSVSMALYEHRQSTFIELSLVQVLYSPGLDF